MKLARVLLFCFALAACNKTGEGEAHKGGAGSGSGAPGSGSGGGGGGRGGGSAANRVVPVVAVPVAQRDVPIYLEGLGNVTAYRTVTVRSQVDGRLDKVLFKEGQAVKKGQQLAQIDPRPFQIQLKNAQGALERDQATLKNAKLNLERYRALVQKKLIAEQQATDQEALVAQTEGALAIDQAAIASARLNLDYARITSSIDGVTGVRLVDEGNLVHAADQTGVVILTQLDPIAVLFTLPQDDLPQIAQQMQHDQLVVEAFSRDGATKLGTGKLELIDNQINQATATLRLKAVFPNPQRVLWPNQFVKARLLLTTRKGALVIPAPALQRGPDGLFVYVVQNDNTVVNRGIEVELQQADQAVVSRGLTAGEMVVVDGQNQLRPGSKVQSRQPGARPQPAARAAPIGGGR